MMQVLVTAATKYGATTEIGQAIAEVLGEHGLEVTVLPPEQVKGVDGYDAVVVGSAVYAGHWLKPAKELVDRCGSALAARLVWLFSSGPVGDPPKPQEDPVDVSEVLTAPGPGSIGYVVQRVIEGLSVEPVPSPLSIPRPPGSLGSCRPAGCCARRSASRLTIRSPGRGRPTSVSVAPHRIVQGRTSLK